MKWIVCFCESKNIGLWKLLTKHRVGFSHVYAVNYDPKLDIWRKVEIASNGFNFETLRGDEATKLVLTMFTHKCIEFETGDDFIYIPRLMYCVSFVKHLCNIDKFWLITPYQLYCELLKQKGKVTFDISELEGVN